MFGAGKLEQRFIFPPRSPGDGLLPTGGPIMKRRSPPPPNPTSKKGEQAVRKPGSGKVWVNPKATFKVTCARAWKEAEVPSPKFIDMNNLDMRTKNPPERQKAKAAAAGKARNSTKSPGALSLGEN